MKEIDILTNAINRLSEENHRLNTIIDKCLDRCDFCGAIVNEYYESVDQSECDRCDPKRNE